MATGNVSMDSFKAGAREIMGQPRSGAKCSATIGMSYVVSIALFIIGCIGAAGAFPGSAIGWVTVGLAAGGFAFNLAAGGLAKRKIELIAGGIMAAVFIAIGALGGAGILTAQQVGYGVLATVFVAVAVNCIVTQIKKRQMGPQINALVGQNLSDKFRQHFMEKFGGSHSVLIDQFLDDKKADIANIQNLSSSKQEDIKYDLELELAIKIVHYETRKKFINEVGVEHASLIDEFLNERKEMIVTMQAFEKDGNGFQAQATEQLLSKLKEQIRKKNQKVD